MDVAVLGRLGRDGDAAQDLPELQETKRRRSARPPSRLNLLREIGRGGRAELGVERRASVSSTELTMSEWPRAAATVTAVPPEPNAAEACVSQSARRSCRGEEQPRCAGARAAAGGERLRRVRDSLGVVYGQVRAGG